MPALAAPPAVHHVAAPSVEVRLLPGAAPRLRDGAVQLSAQVRCGRRRATARVFTWVHQLGDATVANLSPRAVVCGRRWRTVPVALRQSGSHVRTLTPGPAVLRLTAQHAHEFTRVVDLHGDAVTSAAVAPGALWRLDPPGDDAHVAARGTVAVVASGQTSPGLSVAANVLLGVDPATGTVGWRVKLPGPPSDPVVTEDGTVVVATTDGWTLAADGHTGEVRWVRRIGFPVQRPAADSGTVVFASEAPPSDIAGVRATGQMVALDQATGAVRWRAHPGRADVYAAAADGTVVVAAGWTTSNPRLQLRDILTGAVRWSVGIQGVTSAPSRAGDLVFVDAPGNLEARDVATGALRWRATRGDVPTPVGDLVMAGEGYEEVARDAATGTARWRVGFGDNQVFPLQADGVIHVAMGALWAVSPSNGATTKLSTAPVFGPLALSDTTIVAGGISAFGFARPAAG
ncbi:MAG: PQQ-binding-like beta-propeller repeat protein [Thermoleophilia bacterium]